MVKVLGKIELPQLKTKEKYTCRCADCGEIQNTSFGDPRIEITGINLDKRVITKRMVCQYCADELFK